MRAGRQRGDLVVARDPFPVIHQYPHAHAPISCPQRGIGQQAAGVIAISDGEIDALQDLVGVLPERGRRPVYRCAVVRELERLQRHRDLAHAGQRDAAFKL